MSPARTVGGWRLVAALLALAAGCSSKGSSHADGGLDAPVGDAVDARDSVDRTDTRLDVGPEGPPCPAAGSKALGDNCLCASECGSGFCADGVCCNAQCTEGCKTCAAPGSPGLCTNLPTGATPSSGSSKTTCTSSPVAMCGLDGKCDGAGACRNYPAGTQCKGGSCQGDAVVGGFACNGSGQCKPSASTSICVPYACDPTAGACFDICSDSSQCTSGNMCVAGSCGKRMPGASCATNDQCISGFCADKVCCNVACQGACVSCNQPLRRGSCWPTEGGVPDPRGVCLDEGASSCGHNGTCDGVGGCARYPQDTQCQSPSCAGNKLNTAGTCDGLGTCRQPSLQSCHPFRCVDSACTNTCQTDADCDTGIACVAGTCGPKQNGQTCADASECASNHCVDNVCCDSACTGACRSCALPSAPGHCTAVAASNADPRGVCQDNKATSCGTNGKCDGNGGCQKYPVNTQCGDESCTSNVYTAPSTCNASGQCVAPDAQPCRPYVCNGTKCFIACTTDSQCLGPNVCQMNSCGPKPNGATCSAPIECQSNLCQQGICCQTTCQGACQSCALSGSLGTCSNVVTGTVDPAGLCLDQGTMSCGTNGKCQAGACQKYGPGSACHDPTCPAGTTMATAGSTCDGAGTCVQPGTISCFPYLCGTNACVNACATDGDCAKPAVCINSACGLKPNGLPCADPTECQTNFCAQGFCCQSACTGTCKSCGLTGSLGSCTNVPNGKTDPKQSCTDMGTASCSTDGFCDGNGGCRLYDATTSCAPPTCPGGASTSTSVRLCDGKGACQAATTLACAPYVCNGMTACKAACTLDSDCLAPNICDPQTNLCGNKKRLGQSCSATSDCLTGATCVDGVCCSATGCQACQACNVAGSAGNCTNVPLGVVEPHGLCSANPPCGNTGACNGAGSCQQASTGASCGTATCTGSTFTPVSHCNGSGSCAAPTASSCGAYICGAGACKTTCTADGDCVAPFTCQAGNCALKPNGLACATANQCISGFCTDGVCCGSSACPLCQACNVNGLGSCGAIAAGTAAPGTQCPANPPCGNTGACNGAGACQQAAASVACGAASCSGMTFTPVSHCNGTGACATPTTSTCVPYICGSNACKTSCAAADTDCVTGFYCTGASGTCQPKKGSGAACAAAHECGTGFCVDGVCCGVASCPTCQVCGTGGTCANVGGGTTDPHARCTAGATCGNTGACDGSGNCQQAATSVSCGTASCSGSTFTPVSHCDGNGGCATPTTQPCAPYVCGTNACRSDCSADTDCSSGFYCTGAGGTCQPKKGSGAACGTAHECGTAFCVDGVCCGVGSCPTCQVCGSGGSCVNVGGGGAEPHARCPTGATCGNTGACNGSGACQQAATSVSCGTASCSGSTLTSVSHCDGAGACATAPTSSCVPYVCGTNACRSDCSADTDCVGGFYCTGAGGTCQPKKGSGAACGTAHECGTGNCVDGVCCGVGSCPTCQVCGSAGMCVNVGGGGAEPHARCPTGATCGNTGACDGAGACQQAASSVQCGNPSCSGSTFVPPAFCSGSGTCPNPGTLSCGAYLCGTNACRTTCSLDTDCTSGNYCTGTNGSCSATKAPGASCGSDHECGTSHCVDGVCCNSASCATCQACNVASSPGTCANVGSDVVEPHARCAAGGTCGNTGACNGAGACQQAASSVQCASASCTGATFTPAAFCSGSGSCSTPATQSCAPYVCGTSACKFSCNSDSDCATGSFCTGPNGTCSGKKGLGTGCSADHECGSGNCTDGVCCTANACGTCQSCSLSGNGTCTTVADGAPEPHALCGANGACGNTGFCRGGSCEQQGTSVQCGNPSCSGSTLTLAAFCSGGGGCATPGTLGCAPFVCGTNACKTTCSSDGDCATGNYCNGSGACVALNGPGSTCGAGHECGTGNCVDGVCCTATVCGTCQACNLSGNGKCTTVSNNSAEPHGLCPVSSTCGNTGLCSGGACQQAPTSVKCSNASCTSPSFQAAGFCSGTGSCSVPNPTDCTPFACTVAGCGGGTCSGDGDCAPSDYCTGPGGTCQPKQINGQSCAGNSQCQSNHCTEGFCCSSGSCPSCQSCAVAGLQGSCTNVPAHGADPYPGCVDQGAGSCQNDGNCNGSGGCELYNATTVCSAMCSSIGDLLTSTLCDGLGTCGPITVPSVCLTDTCVAGPPSTCQ